MKSIRQQNSTNVCPRCAEILDWRKKFDKYKPRTKPGSCVRCQQKRVTMAYHIVCKECAEANNVCAKCNKEAEDIIPRTCESVTDVRRALRAIEKERKARRGDGEDEDENSDDDEDATESRDDGFGDLAEVDSDVDNEDDEEGEVDSEFGVESSEGGLAVTSTTIPKAGATARQGNKVFRKKQRPGQRAAAASDTDTDVDGPQPHSKAAGKAQAGDDDEDEDWSTVDEDEQP
ncbi:uncharacterized protein MONBRDRAFT_29579 [Monosiga brevicollis MX1]|uniref:Uncharacterized protein n=1 Tax=Monosiga brevicollis TaxID=81824 RepID=A9VBI2_MONBE|nr:uncharacterized protein MONBRDRAFT_29579 [Monosiga brevicollis MX1]EDQ85103.1 predicted protein [Monosiga brevicollis MX1]|eukprot:XP_001750107.1 hypothetical protein [Monosiga brevicollis MX1]